MERVEAVEVEKLYAFVRAFFGIHLKFMIMRCLSFRQARIQVLHYWCSFTTCLSSRGKLIGCFVSKRPPQIFPDHILSSADKQQPCWQSYGRQKPQTAAMLTILWQTKTMVGFLLEGKHVVNEHHMIWKSHDATRKMPSHGALQCTTPHDWFETNSQHQKHNSEGGKRNWVSWSTGKSNVYYMVHC